MGRAIWLIVALALSGCAYTRVTERDGTVTESWQPALLAVMPTAKSGDIVEVRGIGATISASTVGVSAHVGIYASRIVATDECGLALNTNRPDLIPPHLSNPCGKDIP